MAGGQRTSPKLPYRISIAVILLCGAVASVLIYRDARRAEDERSETEFARRATLRHALTREVLGRHTESLFALSALFSLDETISRDEFIRATAQIEQRLSGALAFEWAPQVSRENRVAVEAAMRRLYPKRGFDIVDFDAEGRIRRAPDRPTYFPICYVEPLRGNELVLGYDLQNAPSAPYLQRARETRQMMVTHQFRLLQEKGQQLGFVIIWPVFRHVAGTAAPLDPDAGGNFAGFLQCVFHVQELLDTVCSNQPDTMLDMLFVDASETDPARRILYFRPAPGEGSKPTVPTEDEFRDSATALRDLILPMGEREWHVLYRPRAEWYAVRHSWSAVLRASTVMLLSGLLAGLVSVIGRRTETIRRQVDERTTELAESRRQYANLLHALPGMAYRATYKHELRMLFASEGACALTGIPADVFVTGDVHVRDFIHPDDLARVRVETKAAITAHRDIEVEYRIRTTQGAEKWVLSRGRGVYGADGELEIIEGIIIDITDAKRAEAARLALERKLLETQKLESLGLLAGGIAHDFNNLLSAILGNASLARMSLDPGNVADPQLRAIETASLRAAELCRQMLAYAGKGRFVVERVDLSTIIEDLLPLLRVSIARSAVLHLELARGLAGVKADATQLRQIVMNLVLNAVDALAGRDGEITVRTGMSSVDKALLSRCVTGQSLPEGEYVFLEVRDTGCGMSPEVLTKIFDPFFTTKFAGRGLGLAAVLGIVRGHNGALLVESEVNRGSSFRLYLPAIVGEIVRLEDPPAETTTPWKHSGEVLVIEDEEPVRIVMVELLKTFGFQVHAVEDGRAGVAAFQENASRWELVVIDLLMPGMSGEQTLGALRAIKPDVRALLVSGYAEGEILSRVKGAGRVGFLPKPFKREAFEAKLKELFAQAPAK